MKIKTLFISLLLIVGAIQVNGQSDLEKRACASFENVQQTCEEDGTVTITFQVSNNTTCESSGLTITRDGGIGQSLPINIGGQSVSNTIITHSGATPGSTICFDVVLHGGQGEPCCSTRVCIDVEDCGTCEDLEAQFMDSSCGPNGWARIMVTGGTQPYSGPGQQIGIAGNFIVSGLNSGTQTLTFMDANGCEVEVTFYMPVCGCEGLEAELMNLSCAPNGTAVVFVSGGSQPYSGPGQQLGTAGNFVVQGLNTGSHTLTFMDSEGCEVEVTFYMPHCGGCDDFEAELMSLTCGPNGWARVMVTGGLAPYSGPGQQIGVAGNFIIQGLSSGPHTLTFTDSNGCEIEVTLNMPVCEGCEDLEADLVSVTCGPNGWARIMVTGGTQPYSGPGQQVGVVGNFIVSGLDSGTHTLIYTDDEGCEVAITFYMPECGCEELEAELVNFSCAPDGTAVVYVTGGSQPYSGPGQQIGTAGNFVIQGLNAGTHTLTFMDSEGCEVEVTFTLDEGPEASVTSVGGCGPEGTAVVFVSGGIQPYTGPGQQLGTAGNFVVQGLDSGTQTLTFMDSNGCSVSVSVTIEEGPEVVAISTTSSDCTDGTVEITIAGDHPPFTGPNNQQSNSGNFNYGGLPPGDYDWSFFDSNGCEVIANFTIGLSTSGCNQFTFSRDETDNISTNLYQETIISTTSAMITVVLQAFTVPDELVVTVNGDEVLNFSAGSSPCDGPSPSVVIDSFCVAICDVVEFTVNGNICPLLNTRWDLDVTCKEKNGGISRISPSDIASARNHSSRVSERYYEEMSLNPNLLINVFPNPVTDVLNIAKIESTFEFKTIRIMNTTGKVFHRGDMSNQDQLQVNTSEFPYGMYIIELTDIYGYKTIEKFTKVN